MPLISQSCQEYEFIINSVYEVAQRILQEHKCSYTDAEFVGDFVDIIVAKQLDKVKQFNNTEEQFPQFPASHVIF